MAILIQFDLFLIQKNQNSLIFIDKTSPPALPSNSRQSIRFPPINKDFETSCYITCHSEQLRKDKNILLDILKG